MEEHALAPPGTTVAQTLLSCFVCCSTGWRSSCLEIHLSYLHGINGKAPAGCRLHFLHMEACSCTVSSDKQEPLRVACSHRATGWVVSKPLASYFNAPCSTDSDNLKSYSNHIRLEGWRDGSAVRSTCYTVVRTAVCVPAPHTKVSPASRRADRHRRLSGVSCLAA